MNVVILDTGCANLSSVKSAVARHGYTPVVSREAKSYYALTNSFCLASARRRPLWINCANVN